MRDTKLYIIDLKIAMSYTYDKKSLQWHMIKINLQWLEDKNYVGAFGATEDIFCSGIGTIKKIIDC